MITSSLQAIIYLRVNPSAYVDVKKWWSIGPLYLGKSLCRWRVYGIPWWKLRCSKTWKFIGGCEACRHGGMKVGYTTLRSLGDGVGGCTWGEWRLLHAPRICMTCNQVPCCVALDFRSIGATYASVSNDVIFCETGTLAFVAQYVEI